MRFQRFTDFPSTVHEPERCRRYWAGVNEHWRSLGWESVPEDDEPAIKDAWITHLQRGPGVVEAPKPSKCWRHVSIRELGEHADDIEAEFTLRILAAFRRCTLPGARLLAIDWLHPWYYFDPHGGICVATRDEWAMPVLPDIESYNYVAQDFSFGVLTGFDECWFVKLFGANLLAAFAADPPERFLRACGSGEE